MANVVYKTPDLVLIKLPGVVMYSEVIKGLTMAEVAKLAGERWGPNVEVSFGHFAPAEDDFGELVFNDTGGRVAPKSEDT